MDRVSGRYAAFLSYSHKDSAEARWLHRRLEAYRIPRRLVGTSGEHGPVPTRLTPIFRDREELPAAGDLSERIRRALAASDHLVILCSPDSAASPWVAKEIAAYREFHPGRPVFAAIVDGEPGDCFPCGLAEDGVEPLAADLRPHRDGRRLGVLKLVAGLAGVPLDALVQRDAQRRVRRVTAVTAAALAAMLVMAVMTTLALQARREAQRQRAEAEGLVDFMLTDLRDRLQKIGRLDVMEAVNQRALQYRRRRPSSSPSEAPDEARARQAIGEDKLEKDDLDGALAAFRLAGDAARRQLALFPRDPQRLLDEAKSRNGIGRVHERRREWDLAARNYESFAKSVDPLTAAALSESATGAINLGNVAAGREDFRSAETHYRRAVELLEVARSLGGDNAHIVPMLANARAWLADSFYRRGQWLRSLEQRRAQRAILANLRAEEPRRNNDAEFRYLAATRGLACSYWKTGNRREAADLFREAYPPATALTEIEGRNASWQLLRRKLSDDILHDGFSLPPGVTREGLVSVQREGDAVGCTRGDRGRAGTDKRRRTSR